MHLLRFNPIHELELVEFTTSAPPYAILSHTWTEGQEVSYDELNAGTGKNKAGYAKILFCGERAARDDLEYFWVDTCCIDKRNLVELSEAINSMFRWYSEAERCYVFLSDVTIQEEHFSESNFRRNRWFTRGWTLQELLAPKSVEFFTNDGIRLGDKTSLEALIHSATKIDTQALRGTPLSQFSIPVRMSWARGRNTTRPEDRAYSLLGIFNVFMPLVYGMGEQQAMDRLLREIRQAKTNQRIATDLPQVSRTQLSIDTWELAKDLQPSGEQIVPEVTLNNFGGVFLSATFGYIDLVKAKRPRCAACNRLDGLLYVCKGCCGLGSAYPGMRIHEEYLDALGRPHDEECALLSIDEDNLHEADHWLVEWKPSLLFNFVDIFKRFDLPVDFEEACRSAFAIDFKEDRTIQVARDGRDPARRVLISCSPGPGFYSWSCDIFVNKKIEAERLERREREFRFRNLLRSSSSRKPSGSIHVLGSIQVNVRVTDQSHRIVDPDSSSQWKFEICSTDENGSKKTGRNLEHEVRANQIVLFEFWVHYDQHSFPDGSPFVWHPESIR